MKKLFKLILFVFLVNTITIHAQTYRDTLTSQIIYNFPKDENAYQKLKSDIKSLEKLEESQILKFCIQNYHQFINSTTLIILRKF